MDTRTFAGEPLSASSPEIAGEVPSFDLTAEFVIIACAGDAAARRSEVGSAPGFRRWRSPEEKTAAHEVSHAVIALLLGWRVPEISIQPDPQAKVGKSGRGIAGFAMITPDEKPPDRAKAAANPITDRRRALECCVPLASALQMSVRAVYRLYAAHATLLVEENWDTIRTLAIKLVAQRTLTAEEIESVFLRRARIKAFYEALRALPPTAAETIIPCAVAFGAGEGSCSPSLAPLGDVPPNPRPSIAPSRLEVGLTKRTMIAREFGGEK